MSGTLARDGSEYPLIGSIRQSAMAATKDCLHIHLHTDIKYTSNYIKGKARVRYWALNRERRRFGILKTRHGDPLSVRE